MVRESEDFMTLRCAYSEEVYPRAVGIVISRGLFQREYAHITVDKIEIIAKRFKLKVPSEKLRFQKTRVAYDFTLRNDILDQQVVDTDDQKVVRVNDVHLLKVDSQLYLAHVDVGLRGLVRRLEWTSFIDFCVRLFSSKSHYLTRDDFIPWKNTQMLTSGRYKNVLRLDVSPKEISTDTSCRVS